MPNVPNNRLYLEVTDLKQWAYCPRVVFYRYCLPAIRPVTYSMAQGTRAHEEATALEVEDTESVADAAFACS